MILSLFVELFLLFNESLVVLERSAFVHYCSAAAVTQLMWLFFFFFTIRPESLVGKASVQI